MKFFIKTLTALIALTLTCALSALAGDEFVLKASLSAEINGPFELVNGLRVRLNGRAYEMSLPSKKSFLLRSLDDGRVYGPFRAVEGRLVKIDGVMYVFSRDLSLVRAARTYGVAEEKPISQSLPDIEPPPMPEMLPIPQQEARRVVPPKNLPELPENADARLVYGWIAPIDKTALEWKIDSKRGNESDLERLSVGGDIVWKSYFASVSFSPSVKSTGILPSDSDVTGASLKSGTGFALSVGYNRPILEDGGWMADVGTHAVFRRDSGEVEATSYKLEENAGTNGMALARLRTVASDVTVTEFALWIDLGLSYSHGDWGLYADLSFQPLSACDVSGKLIYGQEELALDVERKTPICVQAGAWRLVAPFRYFADVTFGSDTMFRLGVGYSF